MLGDRKSETYFSYSCESSPADFGNRSHAFLLKAVCSGYGSTRREDPIEYIDLDNDGIYEIKIPDRISSISHRILSSDDAAFTALVRKYQKSVHAWRDGRSVIFTYPLTTLMNLKGLHISRLTPNTPNLDLHALTNLINLERLWLANSKVSDIRPLAALKRLHILAVSGNAIGDISPLAGLVALRTFQVQGNPITNFTPLIELNLIDPR